MSIKTVAVRIEGVSPLLINRFQEQAEVPKVAKKRDKKDFGSPREQAEKSAYRDQDDKLYVPWSWVSSSISTVASDYKLCGSKKSVRSVCGGAILPQEEMIYFCENFTLANIEVDSRPAVVDRARIMRHRARLEKWSLQFHLQIDTSILPLDQVHEMLSDAGRRAGMGDYRPPKGGPFGRFQITEWKPI